MWVAHSATEEAFVLGEGPVWDARRRRLLWVDIRSGLVLVGRLHDAGIEIIDRLEFTGTVGAVASAADGSLLVAAQERLVVVGTDGRRADGPRLVTAGTGRRLNDGKPDPIGRFLVGTLLVDAPGREELLRLESDGMVTSIDSDLTLSNGLAWSVDGRRLFTIDTYRRTVWVRDYDVASGETGVRTAFLSIDDGHPDGMCMDAEDHAWVAVYGAGEVRRFTPDGLLAGVVKVAAPHVTSVAFAGEDLRTLVITTATQELSEQQLADFPLSGRVFTVSVDVAGAPVPYWEPPYETIT
jgi:sugar lactone lactonase YvrE